jgi:hypothetical protein
MIIKKKSNRKEVKEIEELTGREEKKKRQKTNQRSPY